MAKPTNAERVPAVAAAIALWLQKEGNRGREILDLEFYTEIMMLSAEQVASLGKLFPPSAENFSAVCREFREELRERIGLILVRKNRRGAADYYRRAYYVYRVE